MVRLKPDTTETAARGLAFSPFRSRPASGGVRFGWSPASAGPPDSSGVRLPAGPTPVASGFRACERITLNAKIAKRAKHLFERFFLCGLSGLCVDVISSHPLSATSRVTNYDTIADKYDRRYALHQYDGIAARF